MNLLVCYTPLHVLIAERLLKLGKLENFYLLYICFNESEQHRFYYKRLAEIAPFGADFLVLPHDWRDPLRLIRWRQKNKELAPNFLISGNVKHMHSRLLAFFLGIKKFKTFDDGSGNIAINGYFSDLRENKISKILFSLISPSYLYVNIIKKIDRHFSIYPDENVYSRFGVLVEKIELFEKIKNVTEQNQGAVTIYIGHAFVETGLIAGEDAERLDRILFEKFSINYFLPHPRSRNLSFFPPMRKYASKSPLIAEEFVLSLLNYGKFVRIIGVNSSALLNLAFSRGVEIINIDLKTNLDSGALTASMNARKIKCINEADLLLTDEKIYI